MWYASIVTSTPVVCPLSADQEPQFAELCGDARAGLTEAIDLVLIHNEKEVRGVQPRATLNPLTVLLAVSAWERFVADVRALACNKWRGVGLHSAENGGAYLGQRDDPTRPGKARTTLEAVSGDRLPDAWQVRTFRGWRGKHPQQAALLTGNDPSGLATEVDEWIRLRNAVAHRCLPQNGLDPYRKADAKAHTIQAGWARTVLAVMLQLTDQAIAAIAEEAGYSRPDRFRLPVQWFEAEAPAGLRGVTEPGVLWGGFPLHRS